jgi:hypothetical protein
LVAGEKPVLPHRLWIVGKAIPDDERAIVNPEPNAMAGQDQGRPDRVKAGPAFWWLGGLGLPIGAAFGPGKIVG